MKSQRLKNIIGVCAILIATISAYTFKNQLISPSDNLMEIYHALGEDYPDHYIDNIDSSAIKRGYELVHIGKTKPPSGIISTSISKFYTCTSCHNMVKEDSELDVVDQDARLQFAMDNKIPYLQGSTFWGVVNRESWYNDDYVLKYGDLVRKAESSLKESIQLCAQVCSQGRYLEEWEMNSILSYLWTLQMKVSDLDLSENELAAINELVAHQKNDSAINLLKSKYLTKSPATFTEVPESKKEGYPYTGRPEFGKAIYELGCQHCHHPYGESDLVLDNSVYTFKWLKKNITKNSPKSIYEIIRKGTYSEVGHKEYMPHYTLEKMSHQQVEDLRAYIEMSVK
ncbi:c-type cytochrome [Marivirga sp. S37H4]|uniref:C-type cytochrome n=1 Tax=Marivirga aurantiaca TaxID=2802615 RepID=A0A934WWV1_9BACT|nr:c-type cytochrome [Marivirga aurantiaca]MBK6264573.1 c-type cytochrome [Marivirga aurantiaca]